MVRAPHSVRFDVRFAPSRLVWILLLALATGGFLRAQTVLETKGQGAQPAVAVPSAPVEVQAVASATDLPEVGPIHIARRDALLGLAHWDHSLLGAFEFSARLVEIAKLAAVPAEARPFHPLPAPVARLSTSGARPSINSLIASLKLNQLQRQGMNLNMKSAYGSFRVQYREVFSGRPNGLGGGLGQASAAATYTTPRFGTNNMWDFSAAALMGSGSINTLLGSGFGNSAIGGNGPGRKSDGPTVALKLTF